MSNEQETTQYTANPVANPEQFEFFAFVVENEVAVIIPIMKSIGSDLLIAAWSSDPKIVKLKDEEKNLENKSDTNKSESASITKE